MSKFNKITIGDKAELKHVIKQDDIEKFVELTGDNNKLHTDAEYAATTSFKKPVVHGMLGASFISTIIGTKLPGDGALWYSQSLDFLLPVRIGDEIIIKAEVTKKIKPLNAIEVETNIYNQHRQKVISGIAKIKIVEEETRKKTPKKDHLPKMALVIGGTGGIGKATCLQLADDGFDLAIHCNSNVESAKKIKEEIIKLGRTAITLKADITNESDVHEMMQQISRKYGTISTIVNCATIKLPAIKFSSLVWDDIQSHIDINIKGLFNLIKHVIPIMEREKYGNIINVTTQAIESMPPTESIPYVTAKSALNGFSKALAVELAPKGIRVNMISPGMTNTELISDFPEKVKLLTSARTPLRRIAEAEDIANAISFLASEKSDYITGETIRVNGGQIML